MKNLLFGFIATVMFTGLSFGNIHKRIKPAKVTNIEKTFAWCSMITIYVGGAGGGVSASNRICCAFRNYHSPIISCWSTDNRAVGFMHFDDLDPKLLEYIVKNKLTEIEITKSEIFEAEGNRYKALNGKYKLEEVDGIKFFKINLEKVK